MKIHKLVVSVGVVTLVGNTIAEQQALPKRVPTEPPTTSACTGIVLPNQTVLCV